MIMTPLQFLISSCSAASPSSPYNSHNSIISVAKQQRAGRLEAWNPLKYVSIVHVCLLCFSVVGTLFQVLVLNITIPYGCCNTQ